MKTVILLPESEGKTEGGNKPPIQLHDITKEILKEIKNYQGDKERLYGVKGERALQAHQINFSITTAKTLPAVERMSGVVYKGLGIPPKSDFQLFICTSLFGLVKAEDLIPNYKLKIDKFKADKKWLEHNTEFLKGAYVIDLLPKTHEKSVSYTNGIRIDFTRNGKPVGHTGKLVKGKFARWLLENQSTDFSKFREDSFEWDGQRFVER